MHRISRFLMAPLIANILFIYLVLRILLTESPTNTHTIVSLQILLYSTATLTLTHIIYFMWTRKTKASGRVASMTIKRRLYIDPNEEDLLLRKIRYKTFLKTSLGLLFVPTLILAIRMLNQAAELENSINLIK